MKPRTSKPVEVAGMYLRNSHVNHAALWYDSRPKAATGHQEYPSERPGSLAPSVMMTPLLYSFFSVTFDKVTLVLGMCATSTCTVSRL